MDKRLRNRLIPRKKPIPEINLKVSEEIQNCQNNVCLVRSSSSSSIWSQKSSLVDYGESDDSDTLIDNEDYDYEVNKSCSLVNEAIDEFEN
ncbi:unnamed protein product [Brachionus calyciflorus]|uniref:Uncharacterized protein n=1 Tax=Brachionus calyciflorus TaxID=104777 RepID=A0A813M6C8_9BILA|nr:unnamed protein product [Brachionus calyciflorus]